MGRVLQPTEYVDGDTTSINNIVAVSRIWPEREDVDTEDIATRVAIVNEVANNALAHPDTESLLFFVRALETLREELARLETCLLEPQGFMAPEAGENWLADIMRNLLSGLLENPDELSAKQIIELLVIGARAGALNGPEQAVELNDAFEQALTQELAEAVDQEDFDTVEAIAVTAGSYGFTDLYDDATKALEGQP